jgi:predicted nucleic acid-binding protein
MADSNDEHHAAAAAVAAELDRLRMPLFASNLVLAEIHALILKRFGISRAHELAELIRSDPTTTVLRVDEGVEDEEMALIRKYSDKPFSLTDATSFVLIARHNISYAFAFDSDYRQYAGDYELLTSPEILRG